MPSARPRPPTEGQLEVLRAVAICASPEDLPARHRELYPDATAKQFRRCYRAVQDKGLIEIAVDREMGTSSVRLTPDGEDAVDDATERDAELEAAEIEGEGEPEAEPIEEPDPDPGATPEPPAPAPRSRRDRDRSRDICMTLPPDIHDRLVELRDWRLGPEESIQPIVRMVLRRGLDAIDEETAEE